MFAALSLLLSLVVYLSLHYCLPCPALPCPALPCPALPCPALPCPALPCPALPCPALPCPALPCPALPCPALPCPALPCPALPCPALPCPALPCPALPCPALPCPALPCPALISTHACGAGIHILLLYLWQIDLIRRSMWHPASAWLGIYHLHHSHPADILAAQVKPASYCPVTKLVFHKITSPC